MRNLLSPPCRLGPTVLAGALIAGLAPSSIVQAQPSQFSYEYQNGSIAAEAKINPLVGRLLGRILKQEIPSAVTFSATELVGAFSLPETTASIGNGSITFDSAPFKALLEPYLQQAMGQFAQRYSLPEGIGIETLESVLNYRLVGEGLLNSVNGDMAFTFEYGDDSDRLAIEGLDPAVLALCQEQTCNTEIEGDFDLKLDLKGFGETSEALGIKLPFGMKRMLKRAQRFGFKEFAFADGKLTSVVQVLPNLVLSDSMTPAVVNDDGTFLDEAFLDESPAEDGTEISSPVTAAPDAGSGSDDSDNIGLDNGVNLRDRWAQQPARRSGSHQLTRGDFVLTAERTTAPWSLIYSVPPRE